MSDLANQIRVQVDLRQALEFYGVKFDNRGFACCPFHDEKTASFSIKNNRYKCFGCGEGGSVIDFVMKHYGITFKQAIVRINTDFNLGLTAKKPDYRQREQLKEIRKINEAEVEIKEGIRRNHSRLSNVYRCLCKYITEHPNEGARAEIEEYLRGLEIALEDLTGQACRAWGRTDYPSKGGLN